MRFGDLGQEPMGFPSNTQLSTVHHAALRLRVLRCDCRADFSRRPLQGRPLPFPHGFMLPQVTGWALNPCGQPYWGCQMRHWLPPWHPRERAALGVPGRNFTLPASLSHANRGLPSTAGVDITMR
jgi:hypothetical protein